MRKPSAQTVKLLKTPWLWVTIIFAAAAVWGLAFYWASQLPSSRVFRVWVGNPSSLDSSVCADVEKLCGAGGIKKTKIVAYNPDDYYYSAAFALQSGNVDVYVLKRAEAEVVATSGQFSELDAAHTASDALTVDGKAYGVPYKDDYFIMISASSRKDKTLLYAVIDTISASAVRYAAAGRGDLAV